VLRVGEFRRDQTIEVRQGSRILHREHFRALVPNRSLRLRGGWTAAVAPDEGPVTVSIASGSREEAR
jgi:hypothetical protein